MYIESRHIRLSRNEAFKQFISDHVNGVADELFWEPYSLTFMFKPIKSLERKTVMEREVQRFYRTLVPRTVRHPCSPSAQSLLPRLFGCPDCIVRKNAKRTTRLIDTQINDGAHYNAVVLIHPKCRLREPLKCHVQRQLEVYVPSDSMLRSVYIEPIIETVDKATDYIFKALKRGLSSSDDLLVFPFSSSEL